MEFLFDTANIDKIKKYGEIFPYAGVTSNPSIIKAEGNIDFFNHFREIRKLIGFERSLHVQVVARDFDGIMKEADVLLSQIDEKVYIKIPATEDGLKAIQALKKRNVGVTATIVYSKIQGIMAINAGADFIAPYFNRMENMDIDPRETIFYLAKIIRENNYNSKILAASFKNIAQVNSAISVGAQTVTVDPALLHDVFGAAAVTKAVDDFENDWRSVFGDKGIICSRKH